MRKINITALSTLCLAIFGSLLVASPLWAADKFGLDETARRAGLTQYGDSVPTLAGSVVGTALSLISVVFFILMIYSGFLWMTARGNDQIVTKAKDTLIAAIIGMVLVLSAFAITNFVLGSVNKPEGTCTAESPAFEAYQSCIVGCEVDQAGNADCIATCNSNFPACVIQ